MGVATQNPELRKRFAGKPEYVENFMIFIATQLREIMSKLGVRSIEELVGRTDLLKKKDSLWQQYFKLFDAESITGSSHSESLEFYANLYNDLAPILTEITCYAINNGFIKKSERIEESIKLSQKILGLLKILNTIYIITLTSPDPIEDPRWDSISNKSNTEIVEDISLKLERMDSLELKGQE